MASISRDPNGNRSRQFVAGDGKRRTVRLGKVTQKDAEKVKLKVEVLNAARVANLPLDNDTAAWVAGLGDALAARLAAVGLIPDRKAGVAPTLASFVADF